MASKNPLHPIPHPARKPIVGNLLSIGSDSPVLDMWKIAQDLGGIYWLDMPGMPVIVVSDHKLVDELCDEKRFDKSTNGALRRLRAASHGLFTSDTHEPTWSKPHNILLANFSQRAMQAYHPMMLDIAEQLVTKWERLNFDDEVDVTRDMTALTLDTIGLCGFGYRFNSFYREGFHPFVDAMVRTLETVQDRRGLPLEELMMKKQLAQQRKDIRYMHTMVEDIIRERRASGADIATKPDLLSYMIAGVDKKSGEKLDDKMIRDECIEFLIAGHETTSGLLSFAIYYLLKNPAILAKAQAEVDSVLGTDLTARPTYAQVNRLQYILQILKEALRLFPTAPAVAKRALANTMIGGQYSIHKRNMIILHALAMHRDKSVWGEDADEFNPDHFSREAERALPPNAFKPFGTGQRSCIGRQFALQEAVLTLGMIVQRFKLIDHADYQLKVKEALTIKPEGFKIKVALRDPQAVRGRPGAMPNTAQAAAEAEAASPAATASAAAAAGRHGTSLLVLHGSNLGSAEDLARQLAEAGAAARLLDAARLARRLCRAPAGQGRRGHRERLVQRHGARQRGRVPSLARIGRWVAQRCRATACSAAAIPIGPRPTRRCRAASTNAWRSSAPSARIRAARATRAKTWTARSRTGPMRCGPRWPSASSSRATPARRSRASRSTRWKSCRRRRPARWSIRSARCRCASPPTTSCRARRATRPSTAPPAMSNWSCPKA